LYVLQVRRINVNPRPRIVSGHLLVGTFMRINCVITSTAISSGRSPTLHKGDAGDSTPVEEVERIHNETPLPPPWW
jgi:hypothetical protein